jgi:AraC-like DNA-binding protein
MSSVNFDAMFPDIQYFVYRKCTKDWRIAESRICFIDLTYVLDGEATYYVNGDAYRVKQGDFICIPKGSLRKAHIHSANPMTAYAVNLTIHEFASQREVALPFPVLSHIGYHSELEHLFRKLNDEWTNKADGFQFKVRGLMLWILSDLFRMLVYEHHAMNWHPAVQRTMQYIQLHYHQPVKAAQIAHSVGLNASYLSGLFKKCVGQTLYSYINHYRVNQAENLLLSGEFSVTEAAELCGFKDVYHFSKLFKKIKGYPPSRVKQTPSPPAELPSAAGLMDAGRRSVTRTRLLT